MKYLVSLIASFIAFNALAAQWQNYPTTNTFGPGDTFMIGNGSTNLIATGSAVLGVVTNAAQGVANTSSNLVYGTSTAQAQTIANTSSNNIVGYWGSTTNLVLLSGSNGPPVVGQAVVISGTNAFGATVIKGTNWPSGGGGGALPVSGDQYTVGVDSVAHSIYATNTTSGANWRLNSNGRFVPGGDVDITSGFLDAHGNVYMDLLKAGTGLTNIITIDQNGQLSTNSSTLFVYTNQLLDATALGANGHVKTGATTNLINSEDFTGYTNSVAFTNYATTTNISLTFNGNINSGIATNGPTLFITFAGGWAGSWSIRYTSNITWSLPPQIKWLSGSNSVGTNGVISFTCYGGTNTVEAALKENQ